MYLLLRHIATTEEASHVTEAALVVNERHNYDEKIQAGIGKDTMLLGLGAPCRGAASVNLGGLADDGSSCWQRVGTGCGDCL